ncbi:MAG: S41 family peptidase [Gemmatimonadales bacterium]|nr:S41 family peptidase [Gemmatimonadales bacterium]
MRRRHWLAATVILGLPLGIGAFVQQSQSAGDGARLFSQVIQRIEESAVDSLARAAIFERAARGLVKQLNDPYADLYSPEELASFQRQTLRNNYAGVGMQIESQDGAIIVARVFPNAPSEKGGVLAGDRIVAVDSVPVTGLRLDQVSQRLLGTPGTEVKVVFQRPGLPEPIRTTFKRAVVRVPAVPYTLVLDGGVGYIPLQSFNESAAQDVERSLQALKQQGARSFIIDVRGNGGGSLEQALEIGNLFFRPGQELASVRHRGRTPEVYRATRTSVVDSMPVAVLVDGYSASASEIVAGSLQDHDRALVVGTTSFGKGLVQTLYPLDGGWAMKITTGKWYTPSGRSIQADHDRLGDERFVEYAAEPGQTDSTRQRPVFKSDGGRPILGGGGITPDIIVQSDTLTDPERNLARAFGAHQSQWYIAVYSTSLDLKGSVKPDFAVQPAWRETVWKKLQASKVTVTRDQFEAGSALVDRELERWTSRLAFGDSAWFRRSIKYDRQLQTAMEYLQRSPTQRQLLAQVPPMEATKP